jgi:hypothetical protein
MQRLVVITVDTLLEVLKDYCGAEGIPDDAQVETLLVNPAEKGKFALNVSSPQFREDMPALNVEFMLKRVYTV